MTTEKEYRREYHRPEVIHGSWKGEPAEVILEEKMGFGGWGFWHWSIRVKTPTQPLVWFASYRKYDKAKALFERVRNKFELLERVSQ